MLVPGASASMAPVVGEPLHLPQSPFHSVWVVVLLRLRIPSLAPALAPMEASGRANRPSSAVFPAFICRVAASSPLVRRARDQALSRLMAVIEGGSAVRGALSPLTCRRTGRIRRRVRLRLHHTDTHRCGNRLFGAHERPTSHSGSTSKPLTLVLVTQISWVGGRERRPDSAIRATTRAGAQPSTLGSQTPLVNSCTTPNLNDRLASPRGVRGPLRRWTWRFRQAAESRREHGGASWTPEPPPSGIFRAP